MKLPSPAALWNATNQARIEECQRIIGYRFRNQEFIREALTVGDHNRRLALAGDRIADAQLAARWYDGHDDQGLLPRSQWQHLKRASLSNINLAKVGFRMRIQDCTLSPCRSQARMATTVEAILGAVWLDSKCDVAAVEALMDRLGLTRQALTRSTYTTDLPRDKVQSSCHLPDRFFIGHHLALLQLLFKHSQSFIIQSRTAQQGDLSRHESAREAATERLSTAMWSRLQHILFAPKDASETAQKGTAAPTVRRAEVSEDEAKKIPGLHARPSEQRGRAHKLITGKQTDADNDDSALASAELGPHKDTRSDHISSLGDPIDGATGRYHMETEIARVRQFLCADPESDRSLALQAAALGVPYRRLRQRLRRNRGQPGQEEDLRHFRLLRRQLVKVYLARLKLWLPQDAHTKPVPTSLCNSGQMSVNSATKPGPSDPTMTATVDSTESSSAERFRSERLHREGPVLWTNNTVQYQSVNWKQYLKKTGEAQVEAPGPAFEDDNAFTKSNGVSGT
ncbi:hypothetical protein J7T55_014985 [Diaporthe amygdali]|uniref:uncharacterized protein n=1 Tax=Phomopsis amygdali TaxID=1214568 RepID=UPI0022FE80EC|nr:uncharacterized protein J7T55_014985 [Diaporthe amygdali]KAJ0106909.1 hypothetical protein J7T55_014985 [Diaporthe amygdali]